MRVPYRPLLFAIAILAITAIGLTAGLKPSIFLWLLAFEFVVLIASFVAFIRIEWRKDQEATRQSERTFRQLLHYVQCIKAGRDRFN